VDVVVVALPVGEIIPMDCEGRGGVGFGCDTFVVVVGASGRHCFFFSGCVFAVMGFVLGFPRFMVTFYVFSGSKSKEKDIEVLGPSGY
jgi:hypothetical protein